MTKRLSALLIASAFLMFSVHAEEKTKLTEKEKKALINLFEGKVKKNEKSSKDKGDKFKQVSGQDKFKGFTKEQIKEKMKNMTKKERKAFIRKIMEERAKAEKRKKDS